MNRTLTLALLMALASCGPPPPPHQYGGSGDEGTKRKPGWVDGKPGRYPDRVFLTAVGRGPARGPCGDDARGALARVFNRRVSQVSRDWQPHFTRVGEIAPTVRVEVMNISQLTRVSTDLALKGARIAERWSDGQGSHFCLGVIKRKPTARRLEKEIGRLDRELKQKLKEGEEAATRAARLMAYARCLETMQEREALNVDLRMVHRRGVGAPPPLPWKALVDKFLPAPAKIKVGLMLKGRKAGTLQTCMAEELTRAGLDVLEGTSDVEVMIHGKLSYERAGRIRGVVMVQAVINLRITDVESGKTVAALSETHKAGRPKLQRAVQLAVSKLCKKAAPSLVKKIRERM